MMSTKDDNNPLVYAELFRWRSQAGDDISSKQYAV